MIYFEDIPKRLVREFNKANKTALTIDQVSFTDPRPVSSIYPKPNTTLNTAIGMQLLPGALYTGETTLYYDRSDLQAAFRNAPLSSLLAVQVDRATGVHDLLPELSKRLGARLETKDFYNDPVVVSMGVLPVTIRARPESLLWTGALTVLVWRFDSSSEFVFDYPGKLWAASDALADANNKITGKWVPAHYSYSFDYTSAASVLKSIVAAPGSTPAGLLTLANAPTLQAALVAIDGGDWVSRTSLSTGMNLYQSWPLYNGPVSKWFDQFTIYPGFGGDTMPVELRTLNQIFSPEYDNVLVIQLNNPTYSTWGWPCYGIFHYNNL